MYINFYTEWDRKVHLSDVYLKMQATPVASSEQSANWLKFVSTVGTTRVKCKNETKIELSPQNSVFVNNLLTIWADYS